MTEKNTSDQSNNKEKIDNELRSEILAEYSALRSEVLRRIDLRQQTLTFTLSIAGVILAFGLEAKVNVVLLIYPILALFFACAWAHHDNRIGEIAKYLRDRIESRLDGVKWEDHINGVHERKVRKSRVSRILGKVRFVEFYAQGLFLGVTSLAIVLGLINFTHSLNEYVLLVADLMAMVLIFMVTRRRRETF